MMRKILGIGLLCLLGLLLLGVGGLLAYLSITEYRPEDIEALPYNAGAQRKGPAAGESLRVLSFNIGYGALGAESDFFMDGGGEVRPESQNIIETNLAGIRNILDETGADVFLLQEVDVDSKRSYGIDEVAYLGNGRAVDSAHALNYKCAYVPYPLPTIGWVNSGLYTLSTFPFQPEEGVLRYALPCPFSWPVRMANLKRCLLVTRIPLQEGEGELVLVNLHLEAYDDGAGKAAQTAMLMELLEAEYNKGNYVIAGGDFNCSFPVVDPSAWPILEADNYVPGVIDADALPSGFQWAVDPATATCRLLDKPLVAGEAHQYYVIDGFILSPNVELVSVETMNEGFQFSDHNPVLLEARLLP